MLVFKSTIFKKINDKYSHLAKELNEIFIVPIISGAHGTVLNYLVKNRCIETIKPLTLTKSTRIVRKVQELSGKNLLTFWS